jgi:hypothetical protein
MLLTRSLLIGTAAAIFECMSAQAAVIVDMSPDAIGAPTPGFTASNIATAQNFLVEFTLASAAKLDGVDIYSAFGNQGGFVALGDSVVVKLRNDVAGAPAATNTYSFNSVISAIDSTGSSLNPSKQRLHADFSATLLAAGTYWIGLSGVNEIGWNIEYGLTAAPLWQLNGDILSFPFGASYTAAFRVDGVAETVPEPGSLALLIAGSGLLGFGALRGRAPRKA